MAACKLRIELDEPSRTRVGGEPVAGVVVVSSDKDVQCKGLTVASNWGTHGRGNIARGEVERKELFKGEWLAGQEYRYPFSLASASWPPTYYGHHLNVSHFVEARADVPWALDPKVTEEFRVIARETPDNLAPVDNTVKHSHWIGWLVGTVIVGLLLTAVVPLALIAMPLAAIGFGGYWFFFTFLPRQITGDVSLSVEPAAIEPGQTLRGSCEFTPKRNTTINGITWTVRCAEICVSGSGSNRTTHTHEVLTKTHRLMEPGALQAGRRHHFDFSFDVPASAPPSMAFTDNNISWNSELRIDIPSWPDWTKKVPLVVKVAPHDFAALPASSGDVITATLVDDEPWLTEVLQQVIQSKDDPERLEVVLDAVKEQTFPMTIDVQGEAEEPYEAEIDDEGAWVAAIDPQRKVRLVLFVPAAIGARSLHWVSHLQCTTRVVGYESETGRVMMRLIGIAEQAPVLYADLSS